MMKGVANEVGLLDHLRAVVAGAKVFYGSRATTKAGTT
jgi:hypothetical protein